MRHRNRYGILATVVLGLAVTPAWAATSGFVIGEGPGKLVDSLLLAGYGSDNLYAALVDIAGNTNPTVSGILTQSYLLTLKACDASTPVKANLLSAYAGTGVLINADCTASAISLQASGFNGLAGSTTLATTISGAGAAAVISLSPAYTLDSTHSVFGIIYAPTGPSQSFVLSDEAPGRLITKLVAAGMGSLDLYNTLVTISLDSNPSLSVGALPDAFLNTLALCPLGSPIFTTHLQNVTGTAVAINDDCSAQTVSLQGSTFNGKPGTATKNVDVGGVGPASAVTSTSSSPVTSWSRNVAVGSGTATVTYNAFAILYTPGSAPVPTLSAWGMLLLAGLLGTMAALGLHRGTRRGAAVLPLALFVLAALPARAADQQIIASHSGTTDPTTEGFQVSDDAAPNATFSLYGGGYNYWGMTTAASSTQTFYKTGAIPSQQLADAMAYGWVAQDFAYVASSSAGFRVEIRVDTGTLQTYAISWPANYVPTLSLKYDPVSQTATLYVNSTVCITGYAGHTDGAVGAGFEFGVMGGPGEAAFGSALATWWRPVGAMRTSTKSWWTS